MMLTLRRCGSEVIRYIERAARIAIGSPGERGNIPPSSKEGLLDLPR
jgi:hypothetical protein